jgi:hypothetical protein
MHGCERKKKNDVVSTVVLRAQLEHDFLANLFHSNRAPRPSAEYGQFEIKYASKIISHNEKIFTASRSESKKTKPKPGGFRATHASLIVP